MSLSFQKGIKENFSLADTVIDKFHIIKHTNEAL
jgi:transposase